MVIAEHSGPDQPGRPRPAASVLARGYAFVVVGLRYLIIAGWGAAVAAAIVYLPPLSATSTAGLSHLIPAGSAAARAEHDASRLFGFPIDAAVAIVQRRSRPRGIRSEPYYPERPSVLVRRCVRSIVRLPR